MLSLGPEGERAFGRRHFLELMSVFTGAPAFAVRHGRSEIGFVHPLSFQVRRAGPVVLVLGGRSWEVAHVDWNRRAAYVKPTGERGRSRWIGPAVPLRFELCRAIRRVLAGEGPDVELSGRAQRKLEALREDFAWVDDTTTAVVRGPAGAEPLVDVRRPAGEHRAGGTDRPVAAARRRARTTSPSGSWTMRTSKRSGTRCVGRRPRAPGRSSR